MNSEEIMIDVLDKNDGEMRGTETFALTVNMPNKAWLRRILRRLASGGEITITPSRGGRGHKTVYRRNRNSAGQPRKVR